MSGYLGERIWNLYFRWNWISKIVVITLQIWVKKKENGAKIVWKKPRPFIVRTQCERLPWDSVVRSTKELFLGHVLSKEHCTLILKREKVFLTGGEFGRVERMQTTKTVYFVCRSCASTFFNSVWIMSNDAKILAQIHRNNNIWISIFF